MDTVTPLKPGEDIRPHPTLVDVTQVLKRVYGLTECTLIELQGYDDKNYRVTVSNPQQNITNPHLTLQPNSLSLSVHFIFKITNSMDSRHAVHAMHSNSWTARPCHVHRNPAQFDAHKELMLHLVTRGFRVQTPLRNVRGEYASLETFGSSQHMVRLLSYLEGDLLKTISLTNDIAYKLGQTVARLADSLTSFSHEFYTMYRSIWMLSELHRLSSFLFVLTEPSRVHTVESVLAKFQTQVMDRINSFQHGKTDSNVVV
uniref:Hydroxylysine kinase n=1 Tax=Cacopsylla melanoneura TaxID=428564 RepID=A0A8D8XCG9_9HEMI